MKCCFCHNEDLKVTDSRIASEVNAIRRRRECLGCGQRFTTFETIELSIQVHKRDDRYEDFQQKKLVSGLEAACRHTRISRDQVVSLASEITSELMQRQVRTIETMEIGEMVMKNLRALDPVAYIRFACEYRRFKEIDEFIKALESIEPKETLKSLRDRTQ